jgi:predicted secreted Zn-dependent protease
MDHKLRLIFLLVLIVLVLIACQGQAPEPAASTPLPSPGISIVQTDPTATISTSQGNTANSLIATIAAEPGEAPPYVQGSSGDELVPIPEATIVYYEIEGRTEEELRAELDELGPVDSSGYKGDALAEWFISWNWPGYGSDDCDLSAADVSYRVKVIYPRWTPPTNASSNLAIKWFNYTYKLAKHEKGHVDYVVANYQIVLEAIKGATCETADAAAEAALEPLRAFDLEYDRQTGHGETQGARFP